jgi:hypothetical protein
MGLDMYLIKRKKEDKKTDLWSFDNELIYWRKANQVHKFFCDNGKEIEPQCSYRVLKSDLEELLNRCIKVLEVAKVEKGIVQNGYHFENDEMIPNYEEGITIVNPEEIAKILPTCKGFFFGSTEYNEYYLEDIRYTKESLEALIPTIDFDNEDVFYLASW